MWHGNSNPAPLSRAEREAIDRMILAMHIQGASCPTCHILFPDHTNTNRDDNDENRRQKDAAAYL
jgi:hypothetical protein